MPQNPTADEKQVIYLYILVDCFVHFLTAENMLGVLFTSISRKSFNIQRRKLLRLFMASQQQGDRGLILKSVRTYSSAENKGG